MNFLFIFPTFRESWPKGFPTLLAFMYCCSQTSIEIKNLEIRRDILAEKERDLWLGQPLERTESICSRDLQNVIASVFCLFLECSNARWKVETLTLYIILTDWRLLRKYLFTVMCFWALHYKNPSVWSSELRFLTHVQSKSSFATIILLCIRTGFCCVSWSGSGSRRSEMPPAL
jgi:hypothetical protein